LLLESRELEPGSLVRGKYRILRKLGQGGMGVVYLAEHMLLGGRAALKFLAAELSRDPQFVKRFRNEARATYQLRHPNIIEVLDLDQAEDGCLFIAMEYVDGPSLRTVIKSEYDGLHVRRALDLAHGIVAGLALAHGRGTIHRDIKPENILISAASGNAEQPKVLDFGIASMMEGATAVSRTRGLMLTPEYAAPEQWRGIPAAELDGRTDLYALGGILYEMLTGRKVFHAHNMEGWMYQHLQETPLPPSQFRPELANWPGLDELVLRLLARDHNDRPRDAETINLLEAMQFAPPEAPRPIVVQPTPVRPETIIDEIWAARESISSPPQQYAYAEEQEDALPQEYEQDDEWAEPPIRSIFSTPEAQETFLSKISWKIWSIGGSVVLLAIVIWVLAALGVFSSPPQPEAPTATTAQPLSLYYQAKVALSHADYANAVDLFNKSCDGGTAEACVDLGNLYRDGTGVTADVDKAKKLFQQACANADQNGCAQLKTLQAAIDALRGTVDHSSAEKKRREVEARKALEQ
jgi:serine/threonine protein kinase